MTETSATLRATNEVRATRDTRETKCSLWHEESELFHLWKGKCFPVQAPCGCTVFEKDWCCKELQQQATLLVKKQISNSLCVKHVVFNFYVFGDV